MTHGAHQLDAGLRHADVVAALRAELGRDAVLAGDAAGPDYEADESLRARPVRPTAVVLPAETAQVAAVVEIDAATHVAVVQPGVTLAELDAVTVAHGLVYPVFPGTNASSLGGNVATNAGGMRAVKHGVTRHQVLGIEAVTGTGEAIRAGGRFVKSTSGYDLTQLVVGSEGTLALVTEATLRLHPRLTHTASILAPFDTIDAVAEAIPAVVASGVQRMAAEHASEVLGCGHAGDGNVHFSVYQPDDERRAMLVRAIFEMGTAMGGVISGEHGIGRAKKGAYGALEDPAKVALQRRIKAAFDPAGILNPGCIFDPA
jgi:glycolate oxidase